MPVRTRTSLTGVVLSLVVLWLLASSPSLAAALCENRCEMASPQLRAFKQLWSRSYKRVGQRPISFEEFMLSLVHASGNDPALGDLRSRLLGLIGQYQDCLMACEHQYSKRADNRVYSPAAAEVVLKNLCQRVLRDSETEMNLLTSVCLSQDQGL